MRRSKKSLQNHILKEGLDNLPQTCIFAMSSEHVWNLNIFFKMAISNFFSLEFLLYDCYVLLLLLYSLNDFYIFKD